MQIHTSPEKLEPALTLLYRLISIALPGTDPLVASHLDLSQLDVDILDRDQLWRPIAHLQEFGVLCLDEVADLLWVLTHMSPHGQGCVLDGLSLLDVVHPASAAPRGEWGRLLCGYWIHHGGIATMPRGTGEEAPHST